MRNVTIFTFIEKLLTEHNIIQRKYRILRKVLLWIFWISVLLIVASIVMSGPYLKPCPEPNYDITLNQSFWEKMSDEYRYSFCTKKDLVSAFLPVVFAQSVGRDLGHLKDNFSNLVRAYDKIKIFDAWDEIGVRQFNSVIHVGIIDTGVDARANTQGELHPEFVNVDFGNSLPFSLRDHGEEFRPDLVFGHGTAVAGIIGANNLSFNTILPADSSQMNGILSGVPGLPYTLESRSALPVVFTASFAGSVIENLPEESVVNLSMSFGRKCSGIILGFCIKNADFASTTNYFRKIFSNNPDKLFIVAAGNDGFNATDSTPGNLNLSNSISVGATTLTDARRSDSNFGATVSISAPGEEIYAPVIRDKGNYPISGSEARNYKTNFGATSGATPMVTGVAGLLKAIKSDLFPSEIKTILMRTADPIKTGEPDKPMGSGCFRIGEETGCRLNAERAVRDLLFDFALDSLRVDGNILGGGDPDGTPEFIDDFTDGSLSAQPTASFFFPQPVTESNGLLHLRAQDGARTISRFDRRFFEDDAFLQHLLIDGEGDAVITATFRLDDVLPGQFYALGISAVTPTLTESTAMGIVFSRHQDGSTAVRVNDAAGIMTAFDRVDTAGATSIILRLRVQDDTNTVAPFYSIDGGNPFIGAAQFDFFSRLTTIFTAAAEARVFVQGGVRLR